MIDRLDIMSLPEQQWIHSPGNRTTPQDFAFIRGGLTLALAFGHFFWPKFIEVEGCVVLAENYEKVGFTRCYEDLNGNTAEIEEHVNRVDFQTIYTIAHHDDQLPDEVIDEGLLELGQIIVQSWECAAKKQFPEKNFSVHFETHEDGYPPSVWITSA